MEYHRLGGSETLRTRLLISQRKFNKYIFYVYILFYTNIFCINIYFSNGTYIFYIFIYIFLCKKKFSVKNFNVKLFFHIKTFFSENNVYFVKNIFSQKKKNLLVLQQTNSHGSTKRIFQRSFSALVKILNKGLYFHS